MTAGGSVEVWTGWWPGSARRCSWTRRRPPCLIVRPQGRHCSPRGPPAAVRADKARAPAQPLLLPAASVEAGGPAPPGALRCALGDRGRVREAGLRPALWLSSPLEPAHYPGRAGEDGAGRCPPPAAFSSDDGPQLERAPTTTTRTGFCSSWCSPGNLIKEAVREAPASSHRSGSHRPRGSPGPGASRNRPDPVSFNPPALRGPGPWREEKKLLRGPYDVLLTPTLS